MATTQRDPLISVVVPTYNRSTAVKRAVTSVLDQTYRPIELIIVDDHSPKPVAETLQPIDDENVHVFLIRHEENRGGNAARNTGIDAATGEFIAFLDDDDEWLPEKLERQVAAINGEDAEFAYTGVRNVGPNGETISITSSSNKGRVTKQLLFGNFIGTFSAVMARQSTIDQAGMLDERLPSWQDWEYYVRLSQCGRCVAVPEPLVVRHNAPTGQISRSIEPKRELSYPILLERFRPIAREYDVERKMEGYVTYALGRAALSNGDYARARRDFVRAIARHPFDPSFYFYLAAAGGKYAYPSLRTVKRSITRVIN